MPETTFPFPLSEVKARLNAALETISALHSHQTALSADADRGGDEQRSTVHVRLAGEIGRSVPPLMEVLARIDGYPSRWVFAEEPADNHEENNG